MPDDSAGGMGGRPDPVVPRSRSNRTVTPAIAAALVVLAASFALSVAFVLANGGLDLPAQRPSSSNDSVGAAPSATASPTAAETSSAPPASGPTASATASPAPTPTTTTAPSIAPGPSAGPTARPSSNRYDLLAACPDTPDCWVYVVRQGDNLFSIARYFGVPLNVVEERNPWTRTTSLVPGQKLLLPPPTR